jgi:uncharacterized protein YjiS (DUF1127 family)
MTTTVTDKSGLNPTWAGELLTRSPGRSLFNDFRKAIAGCVAYRALRRAEAELMALDNRTLKDIGLDRSEIRSVLMDSARKHRSGVQPPQSTTSREAQLEAGVARVRRRLLLEPLDRSPDPRIKETA